MLTTLCLSCNKKLYPQGWFKKKIGSNQNAGVGQKMKLEISGIYIPFDDGTPFRVINTTCIYLPI
jgi:hypothetical protein